MPPDTSPWHRPMTSAHASPTARRPTGGRPAPYIGVVVFFFCAGFLVVFFAALLLFCAATAVPELITAAAGSTTAAPKAPIMAAITSCFMLGLHCQAS